MIKPACEPVNKDNIYLSSFFRSFYVTPKADKQEGFFFFLGGWGGEGGGVASFLCKFLLGVMWQI